MDRTPNDLVSSAVDSSESVVTTERLLPARSPLWAAFEAASDAMLLLRVAGPASFRIVAANAAYRRTRFVQSAGLAPASGVGCVLEAAVPCPVLSAEQARVILEQGGRALQERCALDFEEHSSARSGGPPSVAKIAPLVGENEEVQYLLYTSRNLAGATSASSELAESAERFSRVFQLSPAAMAIGSLRTGRFLEVNEACSRLFGHSREEFIGHDAVELQLWHQNSDRDEFYRRFRTEGSVRDLEIIIRTKRDERLTVLFNAERLDFGGEPCIMTSIYDVTSRRHADRVQRRLEAQLRQTQKLEALGTLAGGIAHDFNNLLTVFTAVTDLIELDVESPEETRGHLEELRRATARARALVQQVLTFSRGNVQKRWSLDLRGLVEDAVSMLRHATPPQLEIELRCPREPVTVFADANQLNQVVMNLGTNAIHAMGSQPGTLEIEVGSVLADADRMKVVPGLSPGWFARIAVVDHGHGMDDRTIGRIFEPFFTTKKSGEGTGLGLAVVYGIVREHGGTLEVLSRVGEGTRVAVYIPLHGEATKQLEESPPPDVVARGGGEHVLIVDDESALAQSIAGLLARTGYRVTAVTDAMEALARVTESPDSFDLVVTDIAMPGMTGEQLTRALLELRADLPVILMTGYPLGWTAEVARRLGAHDLLHKPVGLTTLAASVARALEAGARTRWA